MVMPLDGITILDLSLYSPGQYGTMLLADMGADVLNIEEAGRPSGRRAGKRRPNAPPYDGSAAAQRRLAHHSIQRNKRSLRLNLKTDEGQAIFYRLADEADVVLEAFRPGVVKRLRVDYETLRARNPRLIYGSLSGYGQDGPYAQFVGHDINYISIGGALGMIGRKGSPPAIPLNLIGDYAGGGLMTAFAISLAIIAREKTGQGQYLDLAITDGVISLLTNASISYFTDGEVPEPAAAMLNGLNPWYEVYETQDGKWLSVGTLEPWFYEALCRLLGREDFSEYQQTSDAAKRAEIHEHFQTQFKTKTRDEWFKILIEADVCAAPVYTLAEAFADPHNLHRGMVTEVAAPGGESIKQVGVAPKLSETPGQIRNTAPSPGQQTDEVLRSLGYDAAAIAEYREREIVA